MICEAMAMLTLVCLGAQPAAPSAGAWRKILEVTERVDVETLERFAVVEGLVLQIDLEGEQLPTALLRLVELKFASHEKWLALSRLTVASVAEAARFRPARVVMPLGHQPLTREVVQAVRALEAKIRVVELPEDFGPKDLKRAAQLGPTVLAYRTLAGEAPTAQQLAPLARQPFIKQILVLPNDGPEELLELLRPLSPLSLEVRLLPGTRPAMLQALNRSLEEVEVTLLAHHSLRDSDIAPFAVLPRRALKVQGRSLSANDAPADLPERLAAFR
ncbi:MAG: hypothetical protein HY901_00230 [Deltaproteobacteria bacterium]|nr:hypothetical protein [Deltaproteobacteria bacterium]